MQNKNRKHRNSFISIAELSSRAAGYKSILKFCLNFVDWNKKINLKWIDKILSLLEKCADLM